MFLKTSKNKLFKYIFFLMAWNGGGLVWRRGYGADVIGKESGVYK